MCVNGYLPHTMHDDYKIIQTTIYVHTFFLNKPLPLQKDPNLPNLKKKTI